MCSGDNNNETAEITLTFDLNSSQIFPGDKPQIPISIKFIVRTN